MRRPEGARGKEGGREEGAPGGWGGASGRGGGHPGGGERPPAPCAHPAEKEADVYVPLWFERRPDPLTGETACMYKGGYWEAKEKQDWHMCPDIF